METSDGLEKNFAIYYLSRYLLSHGLVPLLNRADHPVVLSEYDAATAVHVDGLRTSGKPVTQAVAQILPFLDSASTGLTAVLEGRSIPVDTRGIRLRRRGTAAQPHRGAPRRPAHRLNHIQFVVIAYETGIAVTDSSGL